MNAFGWTLVVLLVVIVLGLLALGEVLRRLDRRRTASTVPNLILDALTDTGVLYWDHAIYGNRWPLHKPRLARMGTFVIDLKLSPALAAIYRDFEAQAEVTNEVNKRLSEYITRRQGGIRPDFDVAQRWRLGTIENAYSGNRAIPRLDTASTVGSALPTKVQLPSPTAGPHHIHISLVKAGKVRRWANLAPEEPVAAVRPVGIKIRIGREPDNDLCIPDMEGFLLASGHHCELQARIVGSDVLLDIIDLGSRNGTWVMENRNGIGEPICTLSGPLKTVPLSSEAPVRVGLEHDCQLYIEIAIDP